MDVKGDGPDLVERLSDIGARHLWIVYHNYSALAQAKSVPKTRFGEVARTGVSFARANWDFAITDEQLPHPGFGADSGDFRVVPDPVTLVALPHRPGVAQAYGWIVDDGGPWAGDPRARLREQTGRLARMGFAVRMAYEAEFILLDRVPGGALVPADHGRMFTIDEVEARWEWSAGVLHALDAAGVAVHQLARGVRPGAVRGEPAAGGTGGRDRCVPAHAPARPSARPGRWSRRQLHAEARHGPARQRTPRPHLARRRR